MIPPKSGCHVNATLDPDVVYNGGKCNYLNGERTNLEIYKLRSGSSCRSRR